MERAKRALIMAAGYGERMHLITEHTPKTLVSVRGQRILDNQIAALHEYGIYDIYIVVGYLKECFAGVEQQYPGVKLIHNPDYALGNNITSMYYARDYLDGPCVIMDADIIINNLQALNPEFERTTYCCTWFENTSVEWIFLHKDWHITQVLEEGGTGWGLRSISFWTAEDTAKLSRHITHAYETLGRRDCYWDEVPLGMHFNEYNIGIRPLQEEDILEIDTFEELCQADPSYLKKEGNPNGSHS